MIRLDTRNVDYSGYRVIPKLYHVHHPALKEAYIRGWKRESYREALVARVVHYILYPFQNEGEKRYYQFTSCPETLKKRIKTAHFAERRDYK